MVNTTRLLSAAATALALSASAALAQGGRGGPPAPTQPPTNPQALPVDRATSPWVRSSAPTDATIQKIFDEGMQRSQVMKLAQTLLDSIGPRLTGSTDADRAQAMLQNTGQKAVTPQMLRKFAATARERIRLESGGYRRDHLRALAQRVEVAEGEVRIMGSKSRLLQTLVAGSGVNAVPTQGLKWRRRRDSNPRYPFQGMLI